VFLHTAAGVETPFPLPFAPRIVALNTSHLLAPCLSRPVFNTVSGAARRGLKVTMREDLGVCGGGVGKIGMGVVGLAAEDIV